MIALIYKFKMNPLLLLPLLFQSIHALKQSRDSFVTDYSPFGRIQEYSTECQFRSYMQMPGMQMVADWILAIMYGGALCYLMLGLHMNMHKMIEAIDHITSSIRSISTRVQGTGLTKKTMVRVWNKAVANSSLVPIAINAPIFLIMGIEGVKFSQETQSQGGFEQNTQVESHQIGPSILLGQLAINGILYTSLIIFFTQREPLQKIKKNLKLQNRILYYLFLTLTCLSFLWQILIVSVFSPGVIEFWEVLVTLLSIPIPQIVGSYIVDRISHKGQEVQEGNHDESSIVRLAPEEEEETGMGKSGKKFEIDRLQSHSYEPIDFFRVLIEDNRDFSTDILWNIKLKISTIEQIYR